MERAFAADTVDLSVAGDWEEVQIQMGWKIARETPIPAGGWFGAEAQREDLIAAALRTEREQARQLRVQRQSKNESQAQTSEEVPPEEQKAVM